MSSVPNLRIGDIISLRIAPPNAGWLSSEGILTDDCILTSEGFNVENCLWEVMVQHQYNSTKEIIEKSNAISNHRIDDEDEEALINGKKQNEELISASINEDRINEKLMSMKHGKPVAFGDIIQLRHYLSKKFITVSTTSLAKVERRNMRVSLQMRGDNMSWLEFMPRYKYDREGQYISDESELYIRLHERPSEYIHAARKSSKYAIKNSKEINCSLDNTCWKVTTYQSAFDSKTKNILIGNLVTLQEPESSTFITLERRKKIKLDRANVVMSNSIQLSFSSADCNVGTNLLWIIEGEDMFRGGSVTNCGSKVALRDLNSGLYMKMTDEGVSAVRKREDCSFFEFSASHQSDVDEFIPDGTLINLSCQNTYVTTRKSSNMKSQCVSCQDRASALSVVITSKIQKNLGVDLMAGVEGTALLQRFESLIRSSKMFNLPRNSVEVEIKRFFSCMDLVTDFLFSVASSTSGKASSSEASLEVTNTVTKVIRQTMLREQGFLLVLLDIIEQSALGTLNEFSKKNMSSISFLKRGATEPILDTYQDNDVENISIEEEKSVSVDKKMAFLNKKSNQTPAVRQSMAVTKSTDSLESVEDKKKRLRTSFLAAAAKMKLERSGNSNAQKSDFMSVVKAAALKKKFNTAIQAKRHTMQYAQSTPSDVIGKKPKNEAQSVLPGEITRACLYVLFLAIQDNHTSQIAIGDYFAVLLNQVKYHHEATICVQEILKDNFQMLQTKIREKEMKIFMDLLLSSPMNVTLLNLMRSSCTCPGGVDNTQRMVVNTVFHREVLYLKKSSVAKTVGLWRSNTFMQKLRPGTLLEHGDTAEPGQVLEVDTVSKNRESLARMKLKQAAKNIAKLKTQGLSGRVADSSDKDDRSVLISLSERPNIIRRVFWSEKKVYFPSSSQDFEQHVFGSHVLKYGIPDLVVNWTTDEKCNEDYTCHTLFAHECDVPFQAFFRVKLIHDSGDELNSTEMLTELKNNGDQVYISPPSSSPLSPLSLAAKASSKRLKRMNTTKKKSIVRKRSQVVQYFISQMYLAADVCLDRNYVAIGVLEKFYTYSMLLTVLKTPNCPNSLKAPVVRLIRCLYVDREPQVEAKFPRLVKTSVTLQGGSQVNFEDHHTDSPFKFGVLQLIISDYLHDSLDVTSCDELSSEMMGLILCLMKYGYYSDASQLQDIIYPLVEALGSHHKGAINISAINEDDAGPDAAMDIDDNDSDERDDDFFFDSGQQGLSLMENSAKLIKASSQRFKLSSAPKISPQATPAGEVPEQWNFQAQMQATAARVLFVLESLVVLLLVLCLVVAATTFSILGFFTTKNALIYSAFDLFVSVFFVTELSIRMSCYRIVRSEIYSFFSSYLNSLDVVIVVFDIILLSLDPQYFGYAAKFAKSLRAIRIVRLFRVFRAARLLKKIAEKSVVYDEWVLPERYTKLTENEIRTIAGILKTLKMAHDRIEDQKLSIIFSAYIEWKNNSNQLQDEASSITSQYMEDFIDKRASIPLKFDDALADIIMYTNPLLVKEGLNLLRVMKSEKQLLTNCLQKVQILSTTSSEQKFRKAVVNLRKMKKYAETFEIWQSLHRKDHLSIANDLLLTLDEMCEMALNPFSGNLFDLNSESAADVEIQNMFSNLDALEDIMAIQMALLDGSIDDMDPIVNNIMKSCNELMCAYVSGHPRNQEEAFKYFNWFLKKIDVVPSSSRVVKAIIFCNRNLIKQVPHKHLAEFIQKISVKGQHPEYLDLFVGLTSIDDTGDGNIALLRNEISRYVTNSDRSSYILLWCCARGSKDFDARVEAMEPYLDVDKPPRVEELSQDLQYHINLLQLLVGCKLGPKIQAIYPLDYVVAAILDVRTIIHVKNKLGAVLLDMIMSNIESIEASESLWLFFENVADYFQDAEDDIANWTKKSKQISRLGRTYYCKWIGLCVDACESFFSGFNMSIFNEACEVEESTFTITNRSEQDVLEVIATLKEAISNLLLKQKVMLAPNCTKRLEQTVAVLSQFMQHDTDFDENAQQLAGDESRFLRNRLNPVNRQASLTEDVKQTLVRKKYQEFLSHISTSLEELQEPSIQAFLKLPELSANVESDIRFEPFLLRITNYIRSQITRASYASSLDKSIYPSAMWVIQTLRLILENKIDVSINDLSDPLNSHGEIKSATWYHSAMNTCGVTYLCLDLITVGIETSLTVEAIKLLVLLTSISGGNLDIQETIHRYASETDSTLFFEQLKEIIEMQIVWCERFQVNAKKTQQVQEKAATSTKESNLPEEVHVLKLLSAICEGHMSLKLLLKEQDGNRRFVNIVDQLAHFAETLSRLESHACTKVAIRVMHTTYVLIQGPCFGIQEHFVLHTDILSALNRFMRTSRPSQSLTDEWEKDLDSLKELVIRVLRVSVEGQSKNSVVVERLKSTIDISLLSVLLLPVETDDDGNSLELSILTEIQAKYLVFLQSINDEDIEIPINAMVRAKQDIAFVEVMWNGQSTVHYFHIPEIAKDLSESSKSVIIDDMTCISQELKLKDFLKKATLLYREALHQLHLKSYGIRNVWHFIGVLSGIMFVNVLVMNIILIAHYVEDSSGNIFIPPASRNALFGLSIIHCIMSFCHVILLLFVRLPVKYSTHKADGYNNILSFFYALTDILQMWYILYLVVTMVSVLKSYLFLSLLLLDFIVLDTTSRDVLYAVVIPARQLFSTFIIMVIVLYITAVIVFTFFRDEYLSFEGDNNTMWVSVVLAFNYGIRATEGLGQYMFDTTGIRLLVDTASYFILVVILRNIFFGIIINTFGELRSIKEEREDHVSNRCFICGIDRHDYDKMRLKDQGDFIHHRNYNHNIWNYLYFVMKIWYQPRNQDTSLEQYVRKCMERDDIGWFPIGVVGNIYDVEEEAEDAENVNSGVNKRNLVEAANARGKLPPSVEGGTNESSNSKLEVISKINETLNAIKKQNEDGAPGRGGSVLRHSSGRDSVHESSQFDKSSALAISFIESTVRSETGAVLNSLKLLQSSIRKCDGKLNDVENVSKKPQRFAGIKMPSISDSAPSKSGSSTKKKVGSVGSPTPGPSIDFLKSVSKDT